MANKMLSVDSHHHLVLVLILVSVRMYCCNHIKHIKQKSATSFYCLEEVWNQN